MALTQINPALLNGSSNTTTVIQSNGTTAITVDSSQRVGVGTSSPNDVLEVAGNDAYIRVNRNGNEPGILLTYSNSATNRGNIAVTSGGAMYFTSGGNTERMRISSAGVVTTPYNPGFVARKDTVTNTSYSEVTGYDSTDFNTGSYFSTSTGRFTAPVAGVYFFFVDMGWSSNSYSCDICKNGSRYMRLESNGTQAYWIGTSVAISLAVNDYVSLYKSSSGNNSLGSGNQGGFGGFLIG